MGWRDSMKRGLGAWSMFKGFLELNKAYLWQELAVMPKAS